MPEGTPESSGTFPLPSCHIPALLALPNTHPTCIWMNLSHSLTGAPRGGASGLQHLPPCHHGLLCTGPHKCCLLQPLPEPCGLLSETAGTFKLALQV